MGMCGPSREDSCAGIHDGECISSEALGIATGVTELADRKR